MTAWGQKVPFEVPVADEAPNSSTLTTYDEGGGFNAAWSSMLRERAPMPPRFIGQRTCTSWIGSRPNRRIKKC